MKSLAIATLFFLWQGSAQAGDGWFLSLYGGRCADANESDVFTLRADYIDSYLSVLIIGRELATYKNYFAVEAEGQLGKHFGFQDHFECNALLVLRWLLFPWDDFVDTSFAIGEGISLASKEPGVEVHRLGKTSRFLNYLIVDIAFQVPGRPHWSLFARFHHRSGIFGLINGVSGGSNIVGAGVRYSF